MFSRGLDTGKKSSHSCIKNENREIEEEGTVRNKVDQLVARFGQMPPMRIAIEASGKSFWIADRLRDLGHEPVVVDPGRTKTIGASLIKNDKLDARVWATLNAASFLMVVREPTRFSSGREVGAYLGLVPSLNQAGKTFGEKAAPNTGTGM